MQSTFALHTMAPRWAEQLRDAGFTGVAELPLLDYWWAPVVLITASP